MQLHNCLKAFKVSFKAFLCPKILCPNGAWLHSPFSLVQKTAHWRSAATLCQSFFYMLLNICFRLLEVHVRCSQILLLSCKFMSDNSEVAVSHDLIEHSSELPIILCNAHQTCFDGPWKHGLLVHLKPSSGSTFASMLAFCCNGVGKLKSWSIPLFIHSEAIA